MLSRHRVSRGALELLKRFEGYRRTAAQLPDGRWTIGYGHTLTARGGVDVSESDAEALLLYDLIAVAHVVNEHTFAPITQNQFDALCSFAFNIGLDNFRRSQVLKRLNAGAVVQAACAMELWRKADFEGERIVIDALVRRRAAEKALFLTPTGDAWVPVPSAILRPVIDRDALDLVPLQRPAEIETSMQGDRVTVRRDDAPGSEPDEGVAPPVEFPALAVTAAAEAVTGRLEALFADPSDDPEPATDATRATPAPETDLFDFPAELSPEPAPNPLDADFEIPKTPFSTHPQTGGESRISVEMAPFEFIPARPRPAVRQAEPSIVWDLLLLLLGLAFFGFGVFWGLYARGTPSGGLVTPIMVAWPAGLAGVGFLVVAVFRLLRRLGREAERD